MNDRHRQIFGNVDCDLEAFEELMTKPVARTQYVIYFTPRSGSSWLTDVLVQTKRLGRATEAFNPNFMPSVAQSCNARNIHDYIAAITRRLQTRGVFGFEVTFHQLKAIFPGEQLFVEHFGNAHCFWLIRENIVEQAVSLAKMVTTKVGHSAFATEEQRKKSDSAFEYDADLIKHWLNHILMAERGNEDFFQRRGMTPLRMSYERMMPLGPDGVTRLMAARIGVTNLPETVFETRHEKLGTSRNSEYAARFREEHAAYLSGVDAERAPYLGKLDDLSTLLAGLD